MEIAFDPGKDTINRQKHGLSLAHAALMDFAPAYVVLDQRRAYSEAGFQAYGVIADRVASLTTRDWAQVRL